MVIMVIGVRVTGVMVDEGIMVIAVWVTGVMVDGVIMALEVLVTGDMVAIADSFFFGQPILFSTHSVRKKLKKG
jgi:hypothetical protein